MKIFDCHVHVFDIDAKPDPAGLAQRAKAAGIDGCAVLSPDPAITGSDDFYSFEDRLTSVLGWTKGQEDRFFPVFWIHPYEKDALKKAEEAAARGVMGFKMICDRYYVSESCSMELLNKIAELGKPVIFHSGILWGGRVSSQYNRPVNWEYLIEIPKIKFSLAHCSWPWYDECIAVYGKFLESYATNPDSSAEMFFDLTPGTPEVYRRDLMNKLLHAGYDVPHNIMFGTDSSVEVYRPDWPQKWIRIDNEIYDSFGAPERFKELVYHDNAMRFFGKLPKDFSHRLPSCDNADTWNLQSKY